MKEIIKKCKKYSIDEILKFNENGMSESEREKEYLKMIQKKELAKGHVRKALSKRERERNKEFFQWTQCKDPDYNKYYIKLITDLHENIDQYAEVFSMLEDETSRRIFKGICKWRLNRRADYLVDAFYKSSSTQYFEKFENITSQEVFVDCGAFDGDSFRALVQYAGGVSKAYL